MSNAVDVIFPLALILLTAIWTPVAILAWAYIPHSQSNLDEDWMPFVAIGLASAFLELGILLLFTKLYGFSYLSAFLVAFFMFKLGTLFFLACNGKHDDEYVRWPLWFVVSTPWFIVLICMYRMFMVHRLFESAVPVSRARF